MCLCALHACAQTIMGQSLGTLIGAATKNIRVAVVAAPASSIPPLLLAVMFALWWQ